MTATNNQPTTLRIWSQWFDTQSLADELEVSPRTIEVWRLKGEGPTYTKIGRLVRYRREDVQEWLDSRVRRSTSDPGPQA